MGLSLYKTEMHHLADLSSAEIDAIETHVYRADDGTYYLEQQELDTLKDYITPELHKELQAALDADGDFNFLLS